MLLDRSTIRLGEAECNFSTGRTVHFLEMFFCSNKVRSPQFFFRFSRTFNCFFCVCVFTHALRARYDAQIRPYEVSKP